MNSILMAWWFRFCRSELVTLLVAVFLIHVGCLLYMGLFLVGMYNFGVAGALMDTTGYCFAVLVVLRFLRRVRRLAEPSVDMGAVDV